MLQTETTILNSGPVRSVQAIEVIRVESLRGKGTEDDVFRNVVQYWSLDGVLLAEVDVHPPSVTFSYSTTTETK